MVHTHGITDKIPTSLPERLASLSPDAEIYIYGFGMVGRWIGSHKDPRFKGFLDTDVKKSAGGKTFQGLPILHFDSVKASIRPGTYFLVTSADIADVVQKIKPLQEIKWIAAGPLMAGLKVEKNVLGESDEFVQYAVEAVVKCHEAYLDPERVFLRSIDLVITERCSLKCKDCANLMQYYEAAKDIPYDKLKEDLDDLTTATDEIQEIRLIGGEPFMNKDIYRIIEYATANPRVGRLVVYSNATIPLREDQVEVLRHPKVVFSLTDYADLSKNTGKVTEYLDRHGIPYRLHLPENWTDSGTIVETKRTDEELKVMFSECCGKNLFTISDGKLYRCPFAANADRLHAVPLDARNSVSLKADRAAVRSYIYDAEFLPACRSCKGRSFTSPEIVPAIQTKKALQYKRFSPIEVHTVA